MAWTAPLTWVYNTVVTAATHFNVHVKDNYAHLKTSFNDLGQFLGFLSSYSADLSGLNGLHGAVPLAGGIPWTEVVGCSLADGILTKTAADGWGTGYAQSYTWRAAGETCELRYPVRTADRTTFYALSFDFGGAYTVLDYAFYIEASPPGANNLKIYENNAVKNTSTVANGDVISIRVDAAGTVTYYNGTTLLYTSATAASGSLWACWTTNFLGDSMGPGLEWSVSTRHTAGVKNYSAATMVIPVGADKYAGTSGAKTPGSLWCEGDYLHHVDHAGTEYRFLGTVVGANANVKGSLWVEGADLHYISENGDERYCPGTYIGAPSSAVPGSLWMDTDHYAHWIQQSSSNEIQGHRDVAAVNHNDHTDTYSHSGDNATHNNHTDTHGTDHTDHVDHHADSNTGTDVHDGSAPHYADSHSADSNVHDADTHGTDTHDDTTHGDVNTHVVDVTPHTNTAADYRPEVAP